MRVLLSVVALLACLVAADLPHAAEQIVNAANVVLQSGSAATNEWREETVNFYRDYKDLFGEEPGEALGIALLTSADSTKSGAEAGYDDFVLFPPEK